MFLLMKVEFSILLISYGLLSLEIKASNFFFFLLLVSYKMVYHKDELHLFHHMLYNYFHLITDRNKTILSTLILVKFYIKIALHLHLYFRIADTT